MRLIDADKLHYHKVWVEKDQKFAVVVFAKEIDHAHTIDAEPVVHGHWILERESNGKPYCFHCSVCDGDFHHIGIKSATKYCPNCGAKMDEEAEHE